MNRKEYIQKMLDILNENKKFKRLGNCAEFDHAAAIERSMQTMFLKMHKAREIPEAIYKDIRPTEYTRPRMYGVAKGRYTTQTYPGHDILAATRNGQTGLA